MGATPAPLRYLARKCSILVLHYKKCTFYRCTLISSKTAQSGINVILNSNNNHQIENRVGALPVRKAYKVSDSTWILVVFRYIR